MQHHLKEDLAQCVWRKLLLQAATQHREEQLLWRDRQLRQRGATPTLRTVYKDTIISAVHVSSYDL